MKNSKNFRNKLVQRPHYRINTSYLLQLVLLIVAIYCLIKCAPNFPLWVTVLLAISFFLPIIGFFTIIGIIIYYLTGLKS